MIYINTHEVILDRQEQLEAWTPYDDVVRMAIGFVERCPVDPANGLPWYLQYSCFWTDPMRPTLWPDNPAGKCAWATTTLLKYYPYSGDPGLIQVVTSMLDRLWEQRTPADFAWPDVTYASAHPGTGVYFGDRADGEYATEPDKVAQAARAFLDFYEMSGEDKYLKIALTCGRALVSKIRVGDEDHSPWPFRVDVRSGQVIEEYTADMLPAVRLFDELIRLGYAEFGPARSQVWSWIEHYPLRNNRWKGYFEDIRIDPENENRDQLSALETGRYILQNKSSVPQWQKTVRGLLDWAAETLGCAPFFGAVAMHEQKFCYFPMGSHTARYASLCAAYAEQTGDNAFREQAYRAFNWATYMANADGTVTVGVDRPDYYNQCWFTDGYFDYVPHFIDGMASLPGLAPAGTDHLLRSTSVVQDIRYAEGKIAYRCFDDRGVQKLRLTFQPARVTAGGRALPQDDRLGSRPGWSFSPGLNVLEIKPGAREVSIEAT
jgi:hypothetical protein